MWKPIIKGMEIPTGILLKAKGGTVYLIGSDANPFDWLGKLLVTADGYCEGDEIKDCEIVEYCDEFVERCKELGVSD